MLTMKQFAALKRNSDGDIIQLYDAYPYITDKQRELLSDDDYSRMDNIDEELEYLADEFSLSKRV